MVLGWGKGGGIAAGHFHLCNLKWEEPEPPEEISQKERRSIQGKVRKKLKREKNGSSAESRGTIPNKTIERWTDVSLGCEKGVRKPGE